MNKRGIIFTIDALIALSIFVAVAIAIYSILTPEAGINIQSSSIYTNSENFMRSSDANESFSRAFYEIQQGNTAQAESIIIDLLKDLPYTATVRLYEHDGSNMVHKLTVNDQDYETSIVLRKFLVLSLTQGIGEQLTARVQDINIQSSEDNVVLPFSAMVTNPEGDEYEYTMNLFAYDSDGQATGWMIVPDVDIFTLLPGQTEERFYTLEIPADSLIGEYELHIDVEANPVIPGPPPINEMSWKSFNVIKYGFVELEVET